MGCVAWKPCFLDDMIEEEDTDKIDEELDTPKDVTSHFQNILLIEGMKSPSFLCIISPPQISLLRDS